MTGDGSGEQTVYAALEGYTYSRGGVTGVAALRGLPGKATDEYL